MKIPEVLLVEVDHKPGSLAQVLAAVGEHGLTVEGLQTIGKTETRTLWELTLEIEDEGCQAVFSAIDALDVATVKGRSDRVFTRHEGGKIQSASKISINSIQTLRDVYTPGVARVCLAIQADPTKARRYTNLHNTVAIVTNGTAILGLGNIGAIAGLPVMEGKAALFHTLIDLSGVPILIESEDPKTIVEVVAAIAPSFGAIQLEDIRAPECFEIEDALRERVQCPVLHDDQHGTAVVALAALLSATRQVGFDLHSKVVGQIGLGAAGLGIVRLLRAYGVQRVLGADLDEAALTRLETLGGERSDLNSVMQQADIVIATTGVRGLIKAEQVQRGQLILALSNPDPEIDPTVALEHGASFAADGRSVNNVLGFPGLFKGVLEAGARCFTDDMLIAAAESLSEQAPTGSLVPDPLDREVHRAVADAVRRVASESRG